MYNKNGSNIQANNLVIKVPQYFRYLVASCLLLWLWLFIDRAFLLQSNNLIIKFTLQLEIVVHFFILIVMFNIYKNAKHDERYALLWFVICNINTSLMDLYGYFIKYVGKYDLFHLGIAVTLFRFFLFLTWSIVIIMYLLKILKLYVLQEEHQARIWVSFAIINLTTILLCFSSVHYTSTILSISAILQTISFIIQIIVFDVVILCLMHAENKGLLLFLLGIIGLVSGYLFLIYSINSQTRISTYGELLWFLGLLFNWFGSLMIYYQADYNIKNWFRKNNSIKSRMVFWCFSMAIVSFLLFFVIAYAFTLISKTVLLGFPVFIIVYSAIVIVLSVYIGGYFEEPFKKIQANVRSLMLKDKKISLDNNFSIEEFIFLQKFILEAFKDRDEKDKAKLGEITAQQEAERLKYENEVQTQKARLLELENETNKKLIAEQEKFRKVVRQLGHDINSPKTSIDFIVSQLSSNMSEEDRIVLRNASESIAGISQRLLSQYDDQTLESGYDNLLVSLVLMQIVNEKRVEHRNTNVVFEVEIGHLVNFTFIRHNFGEFKRMISNIVNNAVDALKGRTDGKITVRLGNNLEKAVIFIKDNGLGMPKHIQDKFFEGVAVTEGKENGHGVGLTQVSDAIKAGNGICTIDANDNGTKFTIRFPIVPTPDWIAMEIKLIKNDTIVILDDDQSIHGIWDSILKSYLEKVPTLQVKHFSQGTEVISYINGLTIEQKQDTFLLTDYELLGQDVNGLDVVAQTNMRRAVIVTSYSANSDIQSKVTQAGIKMLPKELASAAKIIVDQKLEKWSRKVDMVWVEDSKGFVDGLIAKCYSHLKVDPYYDPITFMEYVIQYPLDTRIILDTYYNSADGIHYKIDGFALAEELHKMGYTKLILFAGEAPKVTVPPYLTVVLKTNHEIVDKLDKI